MVIVNSLLSFIPIVFFNFNINGTPYVPSNPSSLDSNTYEIRAVQTNWWLNGGVTYGNQLYDNVPSTSDYITYGPTNLANDYISYNGILNGINMSNPLSQYQSFSLFYTYGGKNIFQVSLNYRDLRTSNDMYVEIHQFNQTNLHLNVRLFTRFTTNGVSEDRNNKFISYSFLNPVVNDYNHVTYREHFVTGNQNWVNYFWYTYFSLEVFYEDEFLVQTVQGGTDSYNQGYDNGYNVGYENGNTNGYNNGYSNGYSNGNSDGYNTGYETGYAEGSVSQETSFLHLFGALADTPVMMIYRLFNFDLFGTSVVVIVLSLLTTIMLIGIVKRFFK